MKMRNKGKVHPSPFSSSSSSSSLFTADKDASSIMKLLPAAILTLASVLSLEDKEVLAYMITRSIKTTIITSYTFQEKSKKSSTKKSSGITHKPPLFDCECFDCYTSYWFKWDSSPNRELIHQAIEAFEEHLNNNGELSSASSKNKGRNKKRDKMGIRGAGKIEGNGSPEIQECGHGSPEIQGCRNGSPEIQGCGHGSPEIQECGNGSPGNVDILPESVGREVREEMIVMVETPERTVVEAAAAGNRTSHKGLARKVLPDVLGLLNSRLWSLWSPNV